MRKIIDGKGRLFGKISIIDVLVVAAVLVLAAGIYQRYFVLDTTAVAVPQEKITYTAKIEGVRETAVNSIRVGDTVYGGSGAISYGTVKDISVENSVVWGTDINGVYVPSTLENRYDITITVEGSGTKGNGKCYINRTDLLSANQQMSLFTKYYQFGVTVTEIG